MSMSAWTIIAGTSHVGFDDEAHHQPHQPGIDHAPSAQGCMRQPEYDGDNADGRR
jgi:hypothetical protein